MASVRSGLGMFVHNCLELYLAVVVSQSILLGAIEFLEEKLHEAAVNISTSQLKKISLSPSPTCLYAYSVKVNLLSVNLILLQHSRAICRRTKRSSNMIKNKIMSLCLEVKTWAQQRKKLTHLERLEENS